MQLKVQPLTSGIDLGITMFSDDVDLDTRDVYQPDEFIEGTNDYGYPQVFQYTGQGYMPVCAQCNAAVTPNRGGGMLCDTCEFDDEYNDDY
jgi:hypothetical protein